MPHALPVPSSGFQALILCGPGLSLNTFTSNPEEFPKALLPIANRPMVWYPLDFCYRSGITKIHLISPASSARAIEVALSQNPHLTSLPLPRADVISPADLSLTSGTAEILRLPEVRAVIQTDFLVLPCDLICEVPGESFLETWMVQQTNAVDIPLYDDGNADMSFSHGGKQTQLKGGLGVWYQTKNDNVAKGGEEADFIITASLQPPAIRPAEDSLRPMLSKLVYSTTKDTLKDQNDAKGSFQIRHSLLRQHGRIRVLNTYRDAHIYVFPRWICQFVDMNAKMVSISEDVVGWWAKTGWQQGLAEKLGLNRIGESEHTSNRSNPQDEGPDEATDRGSESVGLDMVPSGTTQKEDDMLPSSCGNSTETNMSPKKQGLRAPAMLAYIHPPNAQVPLIRRVDTAALLLSVSLQLAKLEPIDGVGKLASSPFAHVQKISHPAGIAQKCTVTKSDCLLAENVTVEEKSVIKESIIGANCIIRSGARLTRCLLMDGVTVEEKCQLTGCILGRRVVVGKDSTLKECEVQDGNKVPDETEAKGEKFMIFEGLEDDGLEDDHENLADFGTQDSSVAE